MVHVIIVLLCLGVTCQGAGLYPTQQYEQTEILAGSGDDVRYALFWNYNDTHVTFEAHVKTTGWVGFGLSSTGGMFPADVVIGWVTDDGTAHLSDRHTVGPSQPVEDRSQDWHLLYGEEHDAWTVLKFGREINTCDSNDDQIISTGTSKVIYAFGSNDPDGDVITYHYESRGIVNMALLSSLHKTHTLPSDAETIDIRMQNITIPSDMSTYYCREIQLTDIGGKRHIIKYELVLSPVNEAYVHHVTLYKCTGHDPVVRGWQSTNCLEEREKVLSRCSSTFMPSAVGAKPFYFPDNVGLSIGAPDDPAFFVLEVHYSNPGRRSGVVDSSGLRFTVTPSLRPQEAGILVLGTGVSPSHVVPPKQQAFMSKGYCSEGCIRDILEAHNLKEFTIFAAFQHAHRIGAAITTRQYRVGEELPPVMVEPHYDFHFQNFRALPEERRVLPGDSFRVDCTYDSTSRTSVTLGGPTSEDEMCITYVLYYPRLPVHVCISQLYLDSPAKKQQLHQYITSADWSNETVVASFQKMVQQSEVQHGCSGYGLTPLSNNAVFVEKDDQTPYAQPSTDCP